MPPHDSRRPPNYCPQSQVAAFAWLGREPSEEDLISAALHLGGQGSVAPVVSASVWAWMWASVWAWQEPTTPAIIKVKEIMI